MRQGIKRELKIRDYSAKALKHNAKAVKDNAKPAHILYFSINVESASPMSQRAAKREKGKRETKRNKADYAAILISLNILLSVLCALLLIPASM